MSPLARLLEAALFASPRAVPESELLLLDPAAGAEGVRAALAELLDRAGLPRAPE